MKTYCVPQPGAGFVIDATGRRTPLNPRLDLCDHSPTGFAFGYSGSGPSQLALAILCDAIGDERALRIYQKFKAAAIAPVPRDGRFEMTLARVLEIAERIEVKP